MNIIKSYSGNIVPIPGMYKSDFSIDESAYVKFVESKIADGDKIFYLAHSASEFKYMGQSERLKVVKIVGNICDKHSVSLLAQPVGSGSIDSQIDEAKNIVDSGVTALVVLPTKPVMAGKFYSCHYEKAGFNDSVHGQYYIEYIDKFSDSLNTPIVFHDAPLNNNKGLPEGTLHEVMSIKNVHGIKVHSSDPCCMQGIYEKYSKDKLCFDGFGKTIQFWSLLWGANTRHTCWSWFDSKSDQAFFSSVKEKNLSLATEIVNREWELAKVIKSTGFGGYKELMRINGLVDNNLTREPGLSLSNSEARQLNDTYNNYLKAIV